MAQRTIPACAGEPPVRSPRCGSIQDYPRVCGGTYCRDAAPPNQQGLSPRVRGNLQALSTKSTDLRTIPACAGEPYFDADGTGGERDYPRVCGGTCKKCHTLRTAQGLSPRVRGNLNPLGRQYGLGRTIPACAGEPFFIISLPARIVDYPRVCGGTCTAFSRFQ